MLGGSDCCTNTGVGAEVAVVTGGERSSLLRAPSVGLEFPAVGATGREWWCAMRRALCHGPSSPTSPSCLTIHLSASACRWRAEIGKHSSAVFRKYEYPRQIQAQCCDVSLRQVAYKCLRPSHNHLKQESDIPIHCSNLAQWKRLLQQQRTNKCH